MQRASGTAPQYCRFLSPTGPSWPGSLVPARLESAWASSFLLSSYIFIEHLVFAKPTLPWVLTLGVHRLVSFLFLNRTND